MDSVCRWLLRTLPREALELPVTTEKRAWLRLWAEFLEYFKWVCNCIGETHWRLGSISLAKAVLQIYEALEDSRAYASAVEGLAGCYYSGGNYTMAEQWYAYANSLATTPAQMVLRANVLANTARVLRSLGRPIEARRLAYDALRYGATDQKLVGLTMGLIAALDLRGARGDGYAVQQFEEASRILSHHPLSLIRVRRLWAEALSGIGEDEEARHLVTEIERACIERGYNHQLLRIASSPSLARLWRPDG